MWINTSGNPGDIETYVKMAQFLKDEEEKKKKKAAEPHMFTLGQTLALFCLFSIPVGLLSNLLFAMMAARYMEVLKSVVH